MWQAMQSAVSHRTARSKIESRSKLTTCSIDWRSPFGSVVEARRRSHWAPIAGERSETQATALGLAVGLPAVQRHGGHPHRAAKPLMQTATSSTRRSSIAPSRCAKSRAVRACSLATVLIRPTTSVVTTAAPMSIAATTRTKMRALPRRRARSPAHGVLLEARLRGGHGHSAFLAIAVRAVASTGRAEVVVGADDRERGEVDDDRPLPPGDRGRGVDEGGRPGIPAGPGVRDQNMMRRAPALTSLRSRPARITR